MSSGSHPFDNEPRSSSNWVARTRESCSQDGFRSLPEMCSQTDLKVKEKIINGCVEYFHDPWIKLPDGQ